MLAKEAKVHVNICDWDFKIHHVVWVYNTTYKITTWYSPFLFNLWDGGALTH